MEHKHPAGHREVKPQLVAAHMAGFPRVLTVGTVSSLDLAGDAGVVFQVV